MNNHAYMLLAALAVLLPVQAGGTGLSAFLRTAAGDADVAARQEAVSMLENIGYEVPFIDDIEVRFRNDGFDPEQQRYTLRLEPRGFGESGAIRALNAAVLDVRRQRVCLSRHQALKKRYNLALELLEREELAVLYNRLAVLYADRVRVMEKRTDGLSFKLDNLVKAEDDYTDLMLKNRERDKRIRLLKAEIAALMPGTAFNGFSAQELIPLEDVRSRVTGPACTLDSGNIYLQYESLQFAQAKRRYALEQAQDRRYIRYLEYTYDYGERVDELERRRDGKDYDVNKAYILEAGFRLPFFNVNRRALNRRKLAYMTDRENYEELKRELSDRIHKDSEDLKILFGQYDYLAARINDVNAESSLKRYLELEGVDPRILLDIKESVIKNEVDMAQAKYAIYRNYIRLMDSCGVLGRAPLRNLLSAKGETLDMP